MTNTNEDEPDEYDDLLTALGRSLEDDRRIAVHEAGHALCARLLGHAVAGVTVNPDPMRGSEGMCWGSGHSEAFTAGRGDASDVRQALASEMPEDGEDRAAVSDVFANVYGLCVELMAGRAAERLLLDEEPAGPIDDVRQARELALLFCKSEEAIENFLSHCDIAARDLLMPHGALLMALSTVLRIKRTLDGTEIDALISDVQARMARAEEHVRRRRWRGTVENANTFTSSEGQRMYLLR